MPKKHVFVCTQSRPPGHPRGSCGSGDAALVFQEFLRQFEEKKLWGSFALTATGCLGPCSSGPNVLVYPEGIMYGGVKKDDVAAIVAEHLLGNSPVQRLRVPEEVWS
ncbi:MAG: (2Fe-2S) ferredoxin domain-containing protein [Burkholderiales bacterium]|nr:(2Fe-2S) ferredoxin domain-containing protein [Burkholderiales bacterium]